MARRTDIRPTIVLLCSVLCCSAQTLLQQVSHAYL